MTNFMRWASLGIILIIAATLAGCGSLAVMTPASSGPGPEESVVVLGIKPQAFHLMFWEGKRDSDGVSVDTMWGNAILSGSGTDGYLVAKASAGKIYVLNKVLAKYESTRGGTYEACQGNRALTIEVPKAKVLYLGDVEYEERDRRLAIRYTDRLEDARKYMQENYPKLARDLVQGEAQRLPVRSKCMGGGTVTIPIYIGR